MSSTALTIPTYFTAADKSVTSTVNTIGNNVAAFAMKAEASLSRAERAFNKLTPSVSAASKQLLSLVGTGAIIAGVVASAKAITDYEKAVASFRVIVDDLSDEAFSKYKKEIDLVAKATKRSSVDVALSFEKIAGLNYKFSETAEGLGAVSTAALILARASGMDLGVSAESLVGIMNQFSYSAIQADKAINILAAGQAVGAANIQQTAEAFVNFGSTAAGANVTLEESVALIQTLGKYSLLGADAGTALRGSIIKLQKAGFGYKSGLFDINDALQQARDRVDKLSTAKKKDAFITDIFGIHNITAGRILLSNIETYKEFVKQVTGTNEAQKQADINSKTLLVSLTNLKNSWINMLTSSDKTTSALNTLNEATQWLERNLDTVISIGTKLLIFFGAWWAIMKVARIALFALNVILGINAGLTGVYSIALKGNTVALAAAEVATWLMTAAQWALNVAMDANPIGLVIILIAGLVAGLTMLFNKVDGWADQWSSMWAYNGAVLDAFIAGIKLVWSGFVNYFSDIWDTIVDIYQRAQNTMGFMSTAQLQKNQKERAVDNFMRKQELADQAELLKLYAYRASTKLEWKLKWHDADSTKKDAVPEVADSQHQRNLNLMASLKQEIKNSIEIRVKADPGTSATASTGGNEAMPTTHSTMPMDFKSVGVQ